MTIRFIDEDIKKEGNVKFQDSQPEISTQSTPEEIKLDSLTAASPIQSAIFPRRFEAKAGKRKGEAVSTALDLVSLPGRALASFLGREKDEDFLESLSKIEEDGFVWNMVRDPATGVAMLTLPVGGVALNAASKLGQLGALTGLSIAEGSLGAATTQAERMTKGEDFQPGQFGTEVAVSASIPLGLRLIKSAIRGGSSLFGKVAEEATGISQKALRTAATKEGAEKLKKAAGTELAIGEEVLNSLDDFDDIIPERGIVNNALSEMGKMDLGGLRVFIERQKIKPIKGLKLSDTEKKVNFALDKLINRIVTKKGLTKQVTRKDPSGLGTFTTTIQKGLGTPATASIDAKDFKKLRTQIDGDIDFNRVGKKAFDILNNKMFAIRTKMKNDLIKRAEEIDPLDEKKFVSGMKAWSEKLRIKESLDDVLGGKFVTRRQKAANMIGNILSKNNKVKFQMLDKFDKIVNQNFIERAELAELAEKLGPDGVPGFLPPQKTGASVKGVVGGGAVGGPVGSALGFGLSSPKLSIQGFKGFRELENLSDLVTTSPTGARGAQSFGGLLLREALGEE